MGNLYTWLIFFGICGFCLAVVVYAVFGRLRSGWIALLSGLVFCLMVWVLFWTLGLGRFRQWRTIVYGLLLAGGSLWGAIRQFQKPSPGES
jgi:hypothetical protein